MGFAQVLCRSGASTLFGIALTVGSIVLGTIGINMWHDTTSDTARNAKLSAFSSTVDVWKRSGRYRFEKAGSWSLSLQCDLGRFNFTLNPNEDSDTYLDLEADNLSYKSLKYVSNDPVSITTSPWVSLAANVVLEAPGSRIEFPLNLSSSVISGSGNWKVCYHQLGGSYDGASCTVRRKLQSMCLRLHWDDTQGNWQLPAAPEASGCSSMDNWQAFRYQTVKSGPYEPAATVNISSLSIILRSDEDPYINGLSLTAGTLNFGLTTHERRSVAVALVVSGSICLAVAIGIVSCCIKEVGPYEAPESPHFSSLAEEPVAKQVRKRTPVHGTAGTHVAIEMRQLRRSG
eukprot:TRINITY_DN80237_c0_g1_i1.p1 TRINITY_DN80237_c0_g1~~TRINITY_DN80237_c0_g1_i1.p1  ORF type:complete len:345 (-),score=40.96 TRINITY_DN80237_c0_g1_i1:18-1052(-)